MNKSLIKNAAYKLLDWVTAGRGIERNINGMKVRFPARWSRYYESDYEAVNYSFLKENVRPGMHIIDIGAHLGLFSACSSQLTGANGKVVCFEPTPGTFAVLKKTLEVNNCGNVIPLQQAIGAKKGEAMFYVSETAACNSNSLIENVTEGTAGQYKVSVTSIDDIVSEYKLSPGLIKIDAEGAELDAVRGGLDTFKRYKPVLILGLHPGFIKRKGDSIGAIWDLLAGIPYKIELDGKEISKELFCSYETIFDVQCTASE